MLLLIHSPYRRAIGEDPEHQSKAAHYRDVGKDTEHQRRTRQNPLAQKRAAAGYLYTKAPSICILRIGNHYFANTGTTTISELFYSLLF